MEKLVLSSNPNCCKWLTQKSLIKTIWFILFSLLRFKEQLFFILFTGLIFQYPLIIQAQSSNALIIDHFHYTENSGREELDMSLHFTNQGWVNSIQEQTIQLVQEIINVNDVAYNNNMQFSFSPSYRETKKRGQSKADYFITIISLMRESAGQSFKRWGPNYVNYTMVLKARIIDAKNKKVFNGKTKLYFQLRRPNYLYGAFISNKDFEKMYSDLLLAVFKKKKKLEKKTVKYIKNDQYDKFENESIHFTLLSKPNGRMLYGEYFINGQYLLQNKQVKTAGQIQIKGNLPQTEFTEIFNINLSNRLLQTSNLTNSITGENLDVLAGISTSLDLKFEKKQLEIPRVVVNQGKSEIGKFELFEPGVFKGEYLGEQYKVKIKYLIDLFEVYQNEELKAIIQMGPYIEENKGMYKNIALFKKGLNKKEQGTLLDIYFFARMANYIRKEAIKEEEREDDDD